MTFDEYEKEAARTDTTEPTSLDAIAMHAMGLAGEAGEYLELAKKRLFHGAELDRERAAKELGDVLWYLARAAADLGLPLSEIARRNIEKLRTRYPDGFSAAASEARVDEVRQA